MNIDIKKLYWVFALAFMFDFRGEKGGSPVQLLFVGAATVSGLLILFVGRKLLFSRPMGVVAFIWILLFFYSIVLAVLEGIEPGNYLRNIIPIFLCGLSMSVVVVMANHRFHPRDILRPLFYMGTINCIWRVVYPVVIAGNPIEKVRTNILSPALWFMFGIVACAIILRDKLTVGDIVAGLVCLAVVALSITRTYLITMFAVSVAAGIGVVLGIVWNMIPAAQIVKKARHFGTLILVMVLGAIIMGLVAPFVYERWIERMTNHGGGKTREDLTLLTRKAEARGIWDTMKEKPIRFVTGSGVGAYIYWDHHYFPDLIVVYGSAEVLLTGSGMTDKVAWPGHSTWTFAYYCLGVPGIIMFLFIHFGCSGLSLYAAYLNAKVRAYPFWYSMIPIGILFGAISQSFTDNPFRERLGGFLVGIAVGFIQVFINGYYLVRAGQLQPYDAPDPGEGQPDPQAMPGLGVPGPVGYPGGAAHFGQPGGYHAPANYHPPVQS